MRRLYTILALILVVLLVGCNGWPTATTPTPTSPERSPSLSPSLTASPSNTVTTPSASQSSIVVQGGTLPVAPSTIWQRTQLLLDTDVSPPSRIVLQRPPARTVEYSPYYQLLTECSSQTLSREVGGQVSLRNPNTVYLYVTPNTSASTIEKILVHEYTHIVQIKNHRYENVSGSIGSPLLEGGATYTTDAYAQTYLQNSSLPSATTSTRYETAAPCKRRQLFDQDHFAYQHITTRIDTPGALQEVYTNPPQTTEQLLHGMTPDTEHPRPLTVQVNRTVDSWLVRNSTLGELAVRSVLWTQLSPARAETAASGWGNDRLLRFSNGTNDSYVWVIRWDDPANSSAFTTALTTYFNRRARQTTTGWVDETSRFRIEQPSADTVVIISGNATLVRKTTIMQSNTTVSVSIHSHP